MIKRACISTLLAAALILMATPVWASYAGYYVYLQVRNTGPAYDMLALNATMQIQNLIDGEYIAANGTDTRVTNAALTLMPHMLVEDRLMWASAIASDSITEFVFWAGQEPLESFPTITGHGGYVTIPDSADLEPGNVFVFYIAGYFDTSVGANKTIIRKDGAVTLNVTAYQEITFAVSGGSSLIASSVASGYHLIGIYSDGTDMWIEVDEVLKDTIATSAIPNTANDWYLFEGNSMPYVYYYGQWVVKL